MLTCQQCAQVKPGDLFICIPEPDVDVGEEVAEALHQGAAAVMTVEAFETDEDVEVPVMLVEACLQAQQFLGAAFYDYPSTKMNVVAVTGMHNVPFIKLTCAVEVASLVFCQGIGHHLYFALSACSVQS